MGGKFTEKGALEKGRDSIVYGLIISVVPSVRSQNFCVFTR